MTESLSYGAFFNRSIQITHRHIGRLLPFTVLLGLYYFVVAISYAVLADFNQSQTLMILMGAWFLFAPLLAGYIYFHEQTLTKKNPSLIDGLKAGFERLLPLFGTLLALILLPGLFIGVMIGIYLVGLTMNIQAAWLPVGLLMLSVIGCALLMNSKIFSLGLVMNTTSDSNTCVEQSKQLVSDFFLRTLFRSTLMFFILLTVLLCPLFLLPLVQQTLVHKMICIGGTSIIIALLTPYLWSFLVIDMHDLEKHRLKRAAQAKKKMQASIQEAPKAEIKKEDWL